MRGLVARGFDGARLGCSRLWRCVAWLLAALLVRGLVLLMVRGLVLLLAASSLSDSSLKLYFAAIGFLSILACL